MGHLAGYWHRTEDGRVQCDLCPRECRLRPGQRGFCFVRANEDGQLVLTTYGRSSGFCIDPVEKKPLNHFLPGTQVFSFGTAGCNLACKYCQNWEISTSREMNLLAEEASPSQIASTAANWQCSSVAFKQPAWISAQPGVWVADRGRTRPGIPRRHSSCARSQPAVSAAAA